MQLRIHQPVAAADVVLVELGSGEVERAALAGRAAARAAAAGGQPPLAGLQLFVGGAWTKPKSGRYFATTLTNEDKITDWTKQYDVKFFTTQNMTRKARR